jgi:hypothetical protein
MKDYLNLFISICIRDNLWKNYVYGQENSRIQWYPPILFVELREGGGGWGGGVFVIIIKKKCKLKNRTVTHTLATGYMCLRYTSSFVAE